MTTNSNRPTQKRKTMKLVHPNPLFEKWLKEWKDEAAAKNSDTQYAFAKALISLKKYPLLLKTGKECLVLENFGTRICQLLDRRLSEYKKNKFKKGPCGNNVVKENEENEKNSDQPQAKKLKKNTDKQKKCSQNSKSVKSYTPALRSSSYAVLVALYNNLKSSSSSGELKKEELQKAAQPLCDTSMFKPLPGSYYSGWSCVGQLVSKQLVKRCGNPHRYSLTDEGINLAKKLLDMEMNTIDPHSQKSSYQYEEKSPIHSENITSKDGAYSSKQSTVNQDTAEDLNFGEWPVDNLSQEPACQNEVEIFMPGTFQVILLVDTQEIHKGDEILKALESQGVTAEVRNLKVGDFAWISRNTIGQELLLPFIIERKRLDDLASSIKDGRFHEQKFRLKQCGVPNCMYLVESHGQRQYSLPTSTLLQAAVNTQFVDRFIVKYTENTHETVVYLSNFTKTLVIKFMDKTLLGCKKAELPKFDLQDDCISLMSFQEFNKHSSKTKKYSVKEMFIKQLVQLRGLSVEKALAIVERYPCPKSLMMAYKSGEKDKLLTDIPAGNLNRKIGPVISKTIFDLYNKGVLT